MIRAFQSFLDDRNIPSSFFDDRRTMIEFTIDTIHYLFVYDFEDDPVYVRILIPNAGQADMTNPQVVRMLYDLTTSYKLGKAYEAGGQVWFAVDAFIYNKENVDMVFLRMIQVLRDMLNQYRTNYNG